MKNTDEVIIIKTQSDFHVYLDTQLENPSYIKSIDIRQAGEEPLLIHHAKINNCYMSNTRFCDQLSFVGLNVGGKIIASNSTFSRLLQMIDCENRGQANLKNTFFESGALIHESRFINGIIVDGLKARIPALFKCCDIDPSTTIALQTNPNIRIEKDSFTYDPAAGICASE